MGAHLDDRERDVRLATLSRQIRLGRYRVEPDDVAAAILRFGVRRSREVSAVIPGA